MNNTAEAIYRNDFFLTAGECNAEGRMPLTLVASRLIEIATEHANQLGIGYARLIEMNLAWVLSRLSIEVKRWLGINETYSIITWIESTNRLFSDRCMNIIDSKGNIVAEARTTWAAIDMTTRRAANPAVLGDVLFPENPPVCNLQPARRIAALSDNAVTESYTFRYCDLDFNRHVNTVRYIDVILNHWPLSQYDSKEIARFDIGFHQECHFGETVELKVDESTDESTCEILRDGQRAVAASITWRNK